MKSVVHVPDAWNWNDFNKATARMRERFLVGDLVAAGPRSAILSSWQRSHSLAISPDQVGPPYDPDLDLESRLVHAGAPVLEWLGSQIVGTRTAVFLVDDQGRKILRRVGEPSLIRHLGPAQDPGFSFAEHMVGTNGIGLALVERRPVHVFGAEHFVESWHRYASISVPVHDPFSGHIEGVVDFVGDLAAANPAMETVIRKAGAAIERRMLEQAAERERALLRAYLEAARRMSEESVAHSGAPSVDTIGQASRLILQERAAELIAEGRRAAIDVHLPHGQTATLLCRPVETRSGVVGLVVEVAFGNGPPHRLTSAAREQHTGLPEGSGAGTAPTEGLYVPGVATSSPPGPTPQRMAGTPGTTENRNAGGPWLLGVGERSIGHFAVAARRRLRVLCEAGACIGTTLDVVRTAEELARASVPEIADFVTIDLPEPVLRGEEPASANAPLRRAVMHGIRKDVSLYPVGREISFLPSTPQARCLARGKAMLEANLRAAPGWRAQDPVRVEQFLKEGIHSLITVPLRARGVTLGVASFYRSEQPEPYEDDDVALAEELVSRAALCLDNARRYTREHTIALTLQRSLLPTALPDPTAVEVAYRYQPAEADLGGVGGDWFDVIPLSSTRVALVVGDVVGHGLHAAVTMGRLRTAVHNFAALDLSPDELLGRLDDLVISLDQDEASRGDEGQVVGATCLYAIYDPLSQICSLARAGHPPPVVVSPDGTPYLPDIPASPPLGLGGLPFETSELHLPENSQLVLYSDGLVEDRDRDIEVCLDKLCRAVAHPKRPAEQTCDAVVEALPVPRVSDDITLLVARTRALAADHVACWDVLPDPATVAGVRSAATRQLSAWALDELTFTTELVLTELLSNAIRHATPPIQVRLIYDRTLICEISDGSSTSPHLRRAADTDEGGRGLFLVAQLAEHWGTRYTPRGKVIWAEQLLE